MFSHAQAFTQQVVLPQRLTSGEGSQKQSANKQEGVIPFWSGWGIKMFVRIWLSFWCFQCGFFLFFFTFCIFNIRLIFDQGFDAKDQIIHSTENQPLCVCVCVYIYIYIYIYIYTHTGIRGYQKALYTSLWKSIWVYVYIYIYTHTHTHTIFIEHLTLSKEFWGFIISSSIAKT